MERPLVSIITITYNRADLIHRCIESIQHQTYPNYIFMFYLCMSVYNIFALVFFDRGDMLARYYLRLVYEKILLFA